MSRSVVVGTDGSPQAARAVDFAAALAVRHRMPLHVVHVFNWPVSYPPLVPDSVAVRVDPRALATDLVRSAAADIRARYPDLDVEAGLVDGNPAGALVDLSRQASYLVVGHRGPSPSKRPVPGAPNLSWRWPGHPPGCGPGPLRPPDCHRTPTRSTRSR